MAKRTFHRGLGETSLELKCLFLFGISLALVITVSFLLYWQVTEHVVYRQNPTMGGFAVDQVMLVKHWKAMEGRADSTKWMEAFNITENLTVQESEWYFILPPDRLLSRKNLIRTGAPRTPKEDALLEHYLTMTPEESSSTEAPIFHESLSPNGSKYLYYRPVWAQDTCVKCHNYFLTSVAYAPTLTGELNQLREGDLVAIVSVSVSNKPTQAAVTETWNWLFAVSIITVFLAMIAFYVTIRYVIIRPLRHLRSVSDAISHGNIALRADIRTGDAFEALGTAFNRMLGHMVTAQDELREVNTDLDGKVDELAQVNMQLYETNRMKSDFLATMSHELRTPLNSILGFSDVLGSIDALDEKQKRYVENIRTSGQMLLEMINNILDLAKIESGKTDIRLSDFSIEQVVSAQCDMARPLTEKKNIDLEVHVASGLSPMHQDQARVQQILNNLLSNAIKFTPEGGRIRVAASSNDREELLLEVADTGVGIAEEDQQAIFEKFRQGRTAVAGGDAMTREYSGTGLGLSIIRELCRLLDGEVSVQSELGTGSTFTVRLPWKLGSRPQSDFQPSSLFTPSPTTGFHVSNGHKRSG